MRFICDDNLGKLARYLRAGGFDVYYDASIDDNELIKIALDEDRIIITRDKKLIERTLVRHYHLIEDDHWADQLHAVIEHYDLKFESSKMFTRCIHDNHITEAIDKFSIRDKVWPYVYKIHDEFRRCPGCQRIYWAGTHTEAIKASLKKHGFEII